MRRSLPVVFSVTFVRHGETAANREQRIQGHLDIPLSSLGEKQATMAGKRLCKSVFTRAYSSDLCRAFTTCELILKENGALIPPIKIDTKLRERNFGSVEGLHIEEVKARAAAEGFSWPHHLPPGAESLGDLQARMVAFFKELCQSVYDKNKSQGESTSDLPAEDGDEAEVAGEMQSLIDCPPVENILIVGHGAALKQLYTHFHTTLGCNLPSDPDVLNSISPNTGISEYLVQYSPRKYIMHCQRIHDGEHLKDL